jgi:hypothetical protein
MSDEDQQKSFLTSLSSFFTGLSGLLTGVAAVIVAVTGYLALRGDDDDDGPSRTTVVESTLPNRRIEIVEVRASETRPNGTDACGDPTNYQAANMIDREDDTAWMTPGDGAGTVIDVTLRSPAVVTQVGLLPGYDKFDPCSQEDRFPQLRRVFRVEWEFDDGSTLEQTLRDQPDLQMENLSEAVTTGHIRVTILETRPPGDDDLDYTPISEIRVA